MFIPNIEKPIEVPKFTKFIIPVLRRPFSHLFVNDHIPIGIDPPFFGVRKTAKKSSEFLLACLTCHKPKRHKD